MQRRFHYSHGHALHVAIHRRPPNEINYSRGLPCYVYNSNVFVHNYKPGLDAEASQTYLQHHATCEENLAREGTQYRQCARIYHKGASLRTGHYYAICRHALPDGDWWYYNDVERRVARPNDDHTEEARVYIALYAKDA